MPIPALLGYGLAAGGSALLNYLGAKSSVGQSSLLREQILRLLTPEALSNEANTQFNLFKGSPMYSGLRTRALVGAGALSNQLQTSFARSGLSRSGIAATALPIARSSFQNSFNDIDMNLFAQALAGARSSLTARAGVLANTATPGVGALAAGGTLESLIPLLLAYFGSQKGPGK